VDLEYALRYEMQYPRKKKKKTDDSGNQMHPTNMHKQECSTQIQNALETMLDFVIASPRSSVEGRGEYACGTAACRLA